jgi:hypothetical protein
MFPRHHRSDSAAHGWLDAIRHGLDLVVAFATLRDTEAPLDADDMASEDGAWTREPGVRPATVAGRRAAARRAEQPDGAGRVEWADGSRRNRPDPSRQPDRTGAPPHPHRRPLRPAARTRRPGVVRPEPQPCLTPIVPRRTRTARPPSRGARHA